MTLILRKAGLWKELDSARWPNPNQSTPQIWCYRCPIVCRFFSASRILASLIIGQSQSQNGRKRIQKENTEFVKGIEAHRKDISAFGSEKVSVQVCTILLAGLPKAVFSFSARAVQLLVSSAGKISEDLMIGGIVITPHLHVDEAGDHVRL
jgi:hypothetical protein